MSFEFDFHPEALMILPVLCVACLPCDNPECEAHHWTINIGWLLWTAILVWSTGGDE